MPEIREHGVDVHRVNALNVDRDWVEVSRATTHINAMKYNRALLYVNRDICGTFYA